MHCVSAIQSQIFCHHHNCPTGLSASRFLLSSLLLYVFWEGQGKILIYTVLYYSMLEVQIYIFLIIESALPWKIWLLILVISVWVISSHEKSIYLKLIAQVLVREACLPPLHWKGAEATFTIEFTSDWEQWTESHLILKSWLSFLWEQGHGKKKSFWYQMAMLEF